MIRRPPRSTRSRSSAASDVYKRQGLQPSPRYLVLGSPRSAPGPGGQLDKEASLRALVPPPTNPGWRRCRRLAHVPPGLIGRVERELGVYISSNLGSSEVGPGLSVMLPYQADLQVRERYVGYPIPGTEVKVVDPATGEEVACGEPGELLISGWHLM